MKTRTALRLLAVLVALCVVPVAALAQRGPGGGGKGVGGGVGPGPGPRGGRGDFSETLDLYRVQRMRDALALTDEQTAKIMGIFGDMRKAREAFRAERDPIVEKLRTEVETPAPDERKLRPLLDQLETIKARQDAEEERSRKALFSVLTPIQQARFVFFQSRFESDVRERMDQVRERRRDSRRERFQSQQPETPQER